MDIYVKCMHIFIRINYLKSDGIFFFNLGIYNMNVIK